MSTVTTTAGLTTTRISAGAPGRDYGWEKAVIAHWCGVQVLDIDVENTTHAFGPDAVAIIEIVLSVGTTRDARTLALLLDIPAVRSGPALAWQCWRGWVSALSMQQPVLVTVTAPTTYQET